jgi:hypothetical protein
VDKPLLARIIERVNTEWLHDCAAQISADEALLSEAAEALRNAEIDSIYEWFKVLQSSSCEGLSHETGWTLMATTTAEAQQAELSRMRTALEEIRALPVVTSVPPTQWDSGWLDAYGMCAAIAERALTAGKDWSYCTSRGHEIGSQCTDAADCAKNGCALGRALTAGSGNEN